MRRLSPEGTHNDLLTSRPDRTIVRKLYEEVGLRQTGRWPALGGRRDLQVGERRIVTHVSAKSEYAIKALVRLALAAGEGPVHARDIAAFGGIPAKFLERVMHELRQGGMITSRRGKGGGYALARDPAGITFAEVIDLIEGSDGGKGRMPRDDFAEPLVAPVWRAVRDAVRDVLGSATIADAAARTATGPMYYI